MSVRTKSILNGSLCAAIFTAVCIALVWTAPAVWAADTREYPTHQEIMNYMAQENARVAVIQARQDQVIAARTFADALILKDSERITILETNMYSLMRIAWFTMFLVAGQWVKEYLPKIGRKRRTEEFELKGRIDGDV